MKKIHMKLITALLLLVFIGSESFAQTKARKKGEGKKMIKVDKLTASEYKAIMTYLKNDSEVPSVEFKVAAVSDPCIIGAYGDVECPGVGEGKRCPTSIDIRLPGGGISKMDVNCVGPDEDGLCECEPANR